MTGRRVTVVGDTLLDRDLVGRVDRLCPDAPVPVVDQPEDRPRPGGAGLAALLAAADGAAVTLITALGGAAGARARELLEATGVHVLDLGLDGETPQKVRVRAEGRSLLRLDRGGGGTVGALTPTAREGLHAADAVLVSDYGRGVAAAEDVRAALAALRAGTPVVWDPHPRGPQPVPGATLVTPNAAEAEAAAGGPPGDALAAVTSHGRRLRAGWACGHVAVTLGARGALLVSGDGPPLVAPARQVPSPDPCGAGDRFASRAAVRLAAGALASEAVVAAVEAASGFVAAGGAAAVRPGRPPAATGTPEDAACVVRRVRSAGGTVVATGGCFDLLHAGHVAVLQQARALGDGLVVLLNSDESVRRLKGPGRPLVPAADRAAVLQALSCVDAVQIFDDDTPEAALAGLRPDVWAKGGDYGLDDLPEAAILARWGGQAVVLPYLEGRSTTSIVKEAARRGT